MPDYSKLKALAQQILECIGDEPEGEDPTLPKQDNQIDAGGQDEALSLMPNDKVEGDRVKKKKKARPEEEDDDDDDSIALMASTLAAQVSK